MGWVAAAVTQGAEDSSSEGTEAVLGLPPPGKAQVWDIAHQVPGEHVSVHLSLPCLGKSI